MEIRLISQADDLQRLCREVTAALPLQDCTLSVVDNDPDHDADFWIWDFQPGLSLPIHVHRNTSKHLFILDFQDLGFFVREAAALQEVNLLLKPVSRTMLTAFLQLALSAHFDGNVRNDRDQLLQYLIQANLKLQGYDQDRTNFLARAIHDLHAPLAALTGYCGLMRSGSLGSLTELQQEVLLRMQTSTKRLSRLTLAVYRLTIEQLIESRPNVSPEDIILCLQRALDEIGQYANEKRIAITVDVQPCDENMYFDPDQMEHVFFSLLDNACKFAPKDGCIEIRGYPFFWSQRTDPAAGHLPSLYSYDEAAEEPNSYRVDIRDSGLPIPDKDLDRIFEEHAPTTGSRDRSGGGLALAICRMILDRLHGRVCVQNTDLGPMFSLILPIRPNQADHSPRRAGLVESAGPAS